MKALFKKIIISILTFEAKLVLKKYNPKIIAITGSVGKTSTKDAIYTALNKSYYVRRSSKSFNSEFGVPLTILDCPTGWNNPFIWIKNIVKGAFLILLKHPYPQWLVLEVGADRPGDIQNVARWLPADVVVLTRIGDTPAHVEFYESVEHLSEEKASLIRALKKDGLLVLNKDDERIMSFADRAPGELVTFGLSHDSDIYAENIDISVEDHKLLGLMCDIVNHDKTYQVRLPELLGKHHAYTVLVAFAVATKLGIEPEQVVESLSAYTPPPGRMRIIEGLKGSNIIDDTYNSSPVAVKAGLETLGEIQTDGDKIAILGDMLELGSYAVQAHKEVGSAAAAVCDKLFVVGPRAQYFVEGALLGGMSEKDIVEFKDAQEAGKYTEGILKAGDIVFVKGSQGMRMEKAVEEIMAHPENRMQMLVRQEKEWEVR